MKYLIFVLLSSSAFADINIPVPGDIGSPLATLQINGQPGAGQPDQVAVLVCPADAQGNVAHYGCDSELQHSAYTLTEPKTPNQPLTISSGLLALTYGHHTYFLNVTPGQKVNVTLQKLVPSNRSANVTFFVDFTNPAMQDSKLLELFSVGGKPWQKLNCPNKNSKTQVVCDAMASDDRNRMRDTLISFNKDATYDWFDEDQRIMVNQGRLIVNDTASPKPGEFISVLPGVYGAEFVDPSTSKKDYEYGIVVP